MKEKLKYNCERYVIEKGVYSGNHHRLAKRLIA
jgi:hypothetical protein